MSDYIIHDHSHDGIDRRGFLKCMAWAGTGAFCVLQGGVLKSFALNHVHGQHAGSVKGELSFVQISDSHIGFNKSANPDVIGTLQAAIAKINALPTPPAFVLHTGDLSHLSKPEEFDALEQNLKSLKTGRVFYVPGEHDVLNDDGKQYLERFGKGTRGEGWYSFDQKGVHLIGLVNVVNLKAGGLGNLGQDQLEWLEQDVKHLKSSTPIVVFAHIPLWAGVGLGHRRWRASPLLSQAVRLSDRSERPYPSDHAEGRGQRDVPHCDVHRLPTASAGHSAFSRTNEGPG